MHHKNIIRFTLAAIALLIASAFAFAHSGMEHVMGTITALTDRSITVETVQHKQVTVLLDPSTKFAYSDAQATLKDLKIGDRVVIHAKSNPDKKLVGVTVKWGATGLVHKEGPTSSR